MGYSVVHVMTQHNHELEAGMELIDDEGAIVTISGVRDDGGVYGYVVEGESEHDFSWTEEEICGALVDGNLETEDGRSHELVKNF